MCLRPFGGGLDKSLLLFAWSLLMRNAVVCSIDECYSSTDLKKSFLVEYTTLIELFNKHIHLFIKSGTSGSRIVLLSNTDSG